MNVLTSIYMVFVIILIASTLLFGFEYGCTYPAENTEQCYVRAGIFQWSRTVILGEAP